MSTLLSIEDLSIRLPRGADRGFAVEGVTLALSGNETLCLVGESGSGKSVTAAAILRLLPPSLVATAGRIMFEGEDLLRQPASVMRRVRGGQIGMIFQDPMTALNPLHRIGDQIAEMLRIHKRLSHRATRDRVIELLEQMRLPDAAAAARAYPHELSGGQRQRAMIAMALALEPRLLIADEPTTALDVTTQAQILALIREIQQRTRMGVLFITHDFGVVAEIATRIAVMRNGAIVEQGPAEAILDRAEHDYTRALIAAVPALRPPPTRIDAQAPTVLSVVGLDKTYRRGGRITAALNDVSLSLRRGFTLGIVGESGSGKSTLARCIVRLLAPDSGSIELGGRDILGLTRRQWRAEAARMQMVFQDPYTSLNPRRRVGDLVAQGPMLHGVPAATARRRARELFALVGLDPAACDRYPHEFSGGQRQRIALARAIALDPEILVADEPVSALDVSVQAQVLALLARLREQLGLSIIFITHDLRVAAQICEHVAIMQNGAIVEEGAASVVLTQPTHPYSRALLAAVPGRAWQNARAAAVAG
ncbi:MAG TPA: ABC transporter ATP-binding protein [Candidatus Binataceae bacterium]|nr:ABC transporter ATP-binding protein [Candidatus Binataceae bacterium]